jgi:hypothetical protein
MFGERDPLGRSWPYKSEHLLAFRLGRCSRTEHEQDLLGKPKFIYYGAPDGDKAGDPAQTMPAQP